MINHAISEYPDVCVVCGGVSHLAIHPFDLLQLQQLAQLRGRQRLCVEPIS